MSSACDLYSSSGTTWPVRSIPATAFPRGSAARDRDSAKAWSFFERVESYDADVRVRLAGTGWMSTGSPWYRFTSASEMTLYRRGQILHIQLCPEYNWTSQRTLGIPTEPLDNVYPDVCPNYEPVEMDPLVLFLSGTRGGIPMQTVSPALSATKKSMHSIKSINETPNNSSSNSSQKGSRRASFSK
jgi:hypothetical protein